MVLRNTGQYLSDWIGKREKEIILFVIYLSIVAGMILGLNINHFIQYYFPNSYRNIYTLVLLIVLIGSGLLFRKIQLIELKDAEQIKKYKKGLIGEQVVAYELSLIQGKCTDFYVINCFQLKEGAKGNIDHIVICKKGIFVLETKNVNFIAKNGTEHQKQANQEAMELQQILKNKFNINWVNSIFIYINIENAKYITQYKKCHSIYYKDLEKYFDNLGSSNQNIENTREIYEYLVSLQQST